MTIATRDFGSVEVDEQAVLEFRAPIFGFDELTKYALLSDEETGPGILWLQALEDAEVCFILLDPAELGIDYMPRLPDDARKLLDLEGPASLRVVAVVPQDFKDTTVNLKSPIVINDQKRLAAQVILDEDYPIRMHVFAEEGA